MEVQTVYYEQKTLALSYQQLLLLVLIILQETGSMVVIALRQERHFI